MALVEYMSLKKGRFGSKEKDKIACLPPAPSLTCHVCVGRIKNPVKKCFKVIKSTSLPSLE